MTHRALALPLHRAVVLGEPVLLQGPRGAGKTALVQREFPGHRFVTLNDPADRAMARSEPEEFLLRLRGPSIIDDLQRAPELVAVVQRGIAERPLLLVSSRRLHLPVTTLELYPSTRAERDRRPALPLEMLGRFVPKTPVKGGPPEPERWSQMFLERDVRDLVKVQDLDRFEGFLAAARARSGQVLDQQGMADESGVSHGTVTRWLEVLDTCFLTLRLPASELDFGRRLVKSPKLHFLDGGGFESQVVSEVYRNARHAGERPELRYWRDSNGLEIPLIVRSEEGGVMPVGIAEMPTPSDVARLRRWMELAGVRQGALVAHRPGAARTGGVLRYALGQL